VEARELSHELERGFLNLLVGSWRVKIEESFDVTAHLFLPFSCFGGSILAGFFQPF
jgi:hypothetical protein